MKTKMGSLVESRIKAIHERRKALVDGWAPYIGAVGTYLKEHEHRELSEYDKINIAQCCENALIEGGLRQKSRLFETTYQSNIDFLGIQLPVVAALLPSLVLNKIAIVQALDRRQGAVFYLDVKYGQSKGNVVAGETMIGAKTGQDSRAQGRQYASTRVVAESLGSIGGTTYAGTLGYKPLIAGTLVITDGTTTFTDNGAGVLVSDDSNSSNGSITSYTNGTYTVTFGAPAAAAPTAEYRYDYERATGGVPTVDVDLTSSTIEAEDFPLKAVYKLGAAIDLEKAHGLVLEDELIKYLGGEIKFTMDHIGIDQMYQAAISADAATPAPSFTVTVGDGQEWIFRKFQFLDNLEAASNNIFSKTLRAFGNFIVGGNNIARLVKQLTGHFTPAPDYDGSKVPTGPHVIGNLDGRIVVQDPFLPVNRYIMGYRGDNYFYAGFVFAPYIPLFSTPTLVKGDLEAEKGFMSSAGYKTINAGMFTYGDVSGY